MLLSLTLNKLFKNTINKKSTMAECSMVSQAKLSRLF